MAKLSQKPEWTASLPAGASIVAIIEGQLYRLANSLFVGPKGDKGDTGATGADGADGVDGQTDYTTVFYNPLTYGSTVSNTTDTYADLGPITFDLEANRIYNLEFKLHFNGASGGTKLQTVYSGALLGSYLDGHWFTSSGTSLVAFHVQTSNATQALLATASNVNYVEGFITLVTSTAGTWKLQFANNSAPGSQVLWGGSFARLLDAGQAT